MPEKFIPQIIKEKKKKKKKKKRELNLRSDNQEMNKPYLN